MTSFFAAIWMTIRSIPPYTRNTLLHVLLSLILLFLTAHTINVCNQVPYTKANLTLVTSTGQNDIDLDITVDIGANTIPGNVPDSMFIDKLGANGRTGFRITVLVPSNGEHNTVNWRNAGYGDGLLQAMLRTDLKEMSEYVAKEHPELFTKEDSLYSFLYTDFSSYNSNEMLQIFDGREKKKDKYLEKYYYEKRAGTQDSSDLNSYLVEFLHDLSYDTYNATIACFFKEITDHGNPLFRNGISIEARNPFAFRNKSFFHNRLIWKRGDISRSYLWLDFFGARVRDADHSESLAVWPPNKCSLTINFGTPIQNSGCHPEPDMVNASSITFTDARKIQEISNGGLVLYVKYLDNESLQNLRMFWLTTVLTIILTWFLTKTGKLVRIALRHARNKRRVRA